MRALIIVAALGFPVLLLRAAPPFDEAAADTLIREALEHWQVPGAAVVVVDRGGILYRKGHGVQDMKAKTPITADTIFPLASCTKAFTATLLGRLVDEGRLAWDDPVRKRLPTFRLADPLANDGVTLRDLLCHRTGLAHHDELWYRSPSPNADIIGRAGHLPANRPFRTTFQYQSIMVMAAGLAAANAGGRAWEDLLTDRLLRPLSMDHTTCIAPTTGPMAAPHRLDTANIAQVVPRYEQRQPNPAGSLHTNIRDLANWLIFQLGDGKFVGRPVLSQAALDETHVPHIVQPMDELARALHPDTVQMSYALGWVVQDYRGTLLWTHAGWIDGFSAYIVLAPRAGYGIAVLSNLDRTRMNHALCNSLLDRLLDMRPREWNNHLKRVVARQREVADAARAERERNRVAQISRAREHYVGHYQHPAYDRMTIEFDNNALVWRWHNRTATLRHWRDEEFDLSVPDLDDPVVRFVVDGDRVTGMSIFGVTLAKAP